jgi:putative nucleotidyltransferase with HDIG domain
MSIHQQIDAVKKLGHIDLRWSNPKLQRFVLGLLIFVTISALLSWGYFQIIKIIGISLLTLGLLTALAVYLYKYQRSVSDNLRLVGLLGLILIALAFISKIIIPFLPGYLIPVAGVAMLVTILFNYQLGVLTVLISTVMVAVVTGNHVEFVIVSALSGLIAVFLVSQVSQRSELTQAGLVISLSVAYLGLAMGLIQGLPFVMTLRNAGWGLISGIFSAVLTIGTLPFLETVFGITTSIKLLELSSPNQFLLRELMTNAPGTYNHSVVAANLAESAAEAVGADPLLARVGAYYHDIGKMKRPFFFIENQIDINEHDKINPNLSCLIITAHVKEGVELAREHNLPKEIIEIIQEHHGTTLVTYFYHRAKEAVVKQRISEDDFRYSGVRPRSKEAALVMLADSVEAAARTMSKPSLNRLEQLIRKIVQGKLNDGQLDESALTLADLEKIIKAFTQTIGSVYHYRIEYPNVDTVNKRKFTVYGDTVRQSTKRS